MSHSRQPNAWIAQAAPTILRERELHLLAGQRASVVLVTGDAGIGKTTLLDQLPAFLPQALIASRVPLYGSEPLSNYVLRSAADVVGRLADLRGDDTMQARLMPAVERLGAEYGRELAVGLALRMLDLITAGISSPARKALERFSKELQKSVGASRLAEELSARVQPGAIAVLCGLLHEATLLPAAPRLVLPFERGELLLEQQRAELVELAERMAAGCTVVIEHSTALPESRTAVQKLAVQARRIAELELEPFSDVTVEDWATARGLQLDAARLTQITNGNPMLIADAMRELERGVALDDLPANQGLAEFTKRSWQQLSVEARVVASQLSVLQEPISDHGLEALVEMPSIRLSQFVSDLVGARIFESRHIGRPWFHEMRRQIVRQAILSQHDRQRVAANALDVVATEISGTGRWDRSEELVHIADEALSDDSQAVPERSKLVMVLRLAREELAILAGLIEVQHRETDVVDAEFLLRYCHDFWPGGREAEPHELVSLSDAGLVSLSRPYANIEVSLVQQPTVVGAVVRARIAASLGRAPIPQLAARAAHGGMAARLHRHSAAYFDVGDQPIGRLVPSAAKLAGLNEHREVTGTALIVRGRWRGIPVHLQASYGSAANRDGAASRVCGLRAEVLGERLVVEEVAKYPMGCVAAERWMIAAALAAGEQGDELEERTGRFTDEKAQALRLSTWEAIFELSDTRERWATGLDPATSLHWAVIGEWIVEAEIRGGPRGVVPHQRLPILLRDDFAELALCRQIGLTPDRYVYERGRSQSMPSETDPLFGAIETVRERSYTFNDYQPRVDVSLAPHSLMRAVAAAQVRRTADAQTLAGLLPLGRQTPRPRSFLVVMDESALHEDVIRQDFSMLIVRGETDTTEVELRVQPITPGQDAVGRVRAWNRAMRERFGCDMEFMTWTSIPRGVAGLLGHREQDLVLHGLPGDCDAIGSSRSDRQD